MCEWGSEISVRVLISPHLSHTGRAEWKDVGIDGCIATIVKALQDAGINMFASCCGHGKADGRIDLADGRVLRITQRSEGATMTDPCGCRDSEHFCAKCDPVRAIPESPAVLETRAPKMTAEHARLIRSIPTFATEWQEIKEITANVDAQVANDGVWVSRTQIELVQRAAEAIRDDDDEEDEIEAAVSAIADANFIAQMTDRWLSGKGDRV